MLAVSGMRMVALLGVILLAAAAAEDMFRPPMTPLITFGPMHQIFVTANVTGRPLSNDQVKDRLGQYWSGSPMGINVMVRFVAPDGTVFPLQLLGENWLASEPSAEYATLAEFPQVNPLVTKLSYTIPPLEFISPAHTIELELDFVHLKLPDRLDLVGWPLVFVETAIRCPGCTGVFEASVYLDMNAFNVMHLSGDEAMSWSTGSANCTNGDGSFEYARLGTTAQPTLESFGDDFMLDWGHLYLATKSLSSGGDGTILRSSTTGGNASACRGAFTSGASTLPAVDEHQPRLPSDNYPVVAAMSTFSMSASQTSKVQFIVGYDANGTQYYFGDVLYGAWRRNFTSFVSLLSAALSDYSSLREAVDAFDATLMSSMATRISPHYAKIGALSYRQTFAAIELSFSDRYQEPWAFLKEISSDGDINTMDVIFPASPLFFYFAPSVIKMLLLPVLHYAINETWHNYTYPFSPHQLGVYPVANITTLEQEVMPAENTGNMFLMLLAYLQHTNYTDTDWIYPRYWPVLTQWAMYMVETQLPVPPFQVCTDDFAGPLAENTNLAAKCVVALEAYAQLCETFEQRYSGNVSVPQPAGGWNCHVFHSLSSSYAEFWNAFAVELDPVTQRNHSRLAFNQPKTWSTKYNLLWQKLLKLQKPFTNFDAIARDEVDYYKSQLNEFGFPMDIRHTYQKLDWMTWGSCLSSNVTEFAELFEGIYRMANDTSSRWPLTDLYDTETADIVFMFRSRPVVGAIFAAMMLY